MFPSGLLRIHNRFFKLLSAHPPTHLTCEIIFQCGPFSLASDLRNTLFDLLFELYSGLYTSQSTQCSPPCTSLHYQAYHKSTDAKAGGMQMFIVYDQVVDVTRSQLVIDTFTLVNRLGGCIGFCKEILWLTLLLAGISDIIKKLHGAVVTNMQ